MPDRGSTDAAAFASGGGGGGGGPRLYSDLAWLWPHLSPPAHYVAEARLLQELIAERLGEGPKSILELGAGGGHTLVHLREAGHDCVAVDLSPAMLDHCRALIPGVDARVGDMRDVRLGRTFDVVLIHDAIDYLLTAEDVSRTMQTVYEHLLPGGVALIAPTYTRETFTDGEVADDAPGSGIDPTGTEHDLRFFSFVHDPVPSDTSFEMILLYLLRPRPRKLGAARREVEVIEDRHVCGLFARDDWLSMLDAAGLTAEFIEQGEDDEAGAWSLFVGTRPAD